MQKIRLTNQQGFWGIIKIIKFYLEKKANLGRPQAVGCILAKKI